MAIEQASASGRDFSTVDTRALLEGALGWWTEAGLDYSFDDAPTDWLAAARPPEPAAKAPIAQPIQNSDRASQDLRADPRARLVAAPAGPDVGGDPKHWPQTLDDFAAWWLTEPSLGASTAAQRVPPSGPADAPLMVLVPMPEAGDTTLLLGGREGRLLDAMLAAMGLSRGAIYLASALPAAMPMPDWQGLAAAGLGAVVMHHVALAMPKRLLILGKTDISSLIPHDPANNAAILPSINQQRTSVPRQLPLALDFALATLLAQPSLKRRVWANWLEWTEAGLQ